MKMWIFAVVIWLFAGCQSSYTPPIITSQTIPAGNARGVDLEKLREGRRLFAHRCIECHTLPAIWHYSTHDWPEIVNSMAHRASLKPAERDAIVAYIFAVRARTN